MLKCHPLHLLRPPVVVVVVAEVLTSSCACMPLRRVVARVVLELLSLVLTPTHSLISCFRRTGCAPESLAVEDWNPFSKSSQRLGSSLSLLSHSISRSNRIHEHSLSQSPGFHVRESPERSPPSLHLRRSPSSFCRI